jgi:hypothetical protein
MLQMPDKLGGHLAVEAIGLKCLIIDGISSGFKVMAGTPSDGKARYQIRRVMEAELDGVLDNCKRACLWIGAQRQMELWPHGDPHWMGSVTIGWELH